MSLLFVRMWYVIRFKNTIYRLLALQLFFSTFTLFINLSICQSFFSNFTSIMNLSIYQLLISGFTSIIDLIIYQSFLSNLLRMEVLYMPLNCYQSRWLLEHKLTITTYKSMSSRASNCNIREVTSNNIKNSYWWKPQ